MKVKWREVGLTGRRFSTQQRWNSAILWTIYHWRNVVEWIWDLDAGAILLRCPDKNRFSYRSATGPFFNQSLTGQTVGRSEGPVSHWIPGIYASVLMLRGWDQKSQMPEHFSAADAGEHSVLCSIHHPLLIWNENLTISLDFHSAIPRCIALRFLLEPKNSQRKLSSPARTYPPLSVSSTTLAPCM